MGRRAELMRKNLEALMGAEAMGISTVDLSLFDAKVCKPYVAGLCLSEIFTNTKLDLGTCPRAHSNKLRLEFNSLYAKAEEEKDLPKLAELNRLKVEYENTVRGFVEECDRRIRAAQRRLEKTPEENNRTTALMREIGEIEGAYQAALAAVESLGSEGKVDESMKELGKAEALKGEKEEKEKELQQLTETSGASGHQKLRVCDICGAYLSVLDSDRRLADHFGGKMHLGYHQLRTAMDEWRTRGNLPTAAPNNAPSSSAVPNGPPPINGNNWGRQPGLMAPPPSSAPALPAVVKEKAAPIVFRPIAPGMKGTKPSHSSSALKGPSSASGDRERDSGRRESGRDRDSGRGERSDRDRSDRGERSSGRDSGRDRSDRDRSDRDRSDRGEHRSSRRDDDSDRHRSSRRRDDDDRRRDDDDRRRDDDRSSRHSRRDRDPSEGGEVKKEKSDKESGTGSSSRRERHEYEEGEEPERPQQEKRRKVEQYDLED